MKIIGDFILACLLCVTAAGLVALQFACTINNGIEKYKKENDESR